MWPNWLAVRLARSGRVPRRMPGPVVAARAATAVVVLVAVYLGWFRQAGLPASREFLARRSLSLEVCADAEIDQRFFVRASGLDEVVIRSVSVGPATADLVIFDLHEEQLDGTERLVRRLARSEAQVVGSRDFVVRFTPLMESFGRTYRLAVRMPTAACGQGIRLWTTESRAQGENDASEPTVRTFEMVFEARATAATPAARLVSSAGWPPATQWALLLLVLAGAGWALEKLFLAVVRSSS